MKQHPTDMTAYLPTVKPDETWLTLKDWERYVDKVLIELGEIRQEFNKVERENARLREELVVQPGYITYGKQQYDAGVEASAKECEIKVTWLYSTEYAALIRQLKHQMTPTMISFSGELSDKGKQQLKGMWETGELQKILNTWTNEREKEKAVRKVVKSNKRDELK